MIDVAEIGAEARRLYDPRTSPLLVLFAAAAILSVVQGHPFMGLLAVLATVWVVWITYRSDRRWRDERRGGA